MEKPQMARKPEFHTAIVLTKIREMMSMGWCWLKVLLNCVSAETKNPMSSLQKRTNQVLLAWHSKHEVKSTHDWWIWNLGRFWISSSKLFDPFTLFIISCGSFIETQITFRHLLANKQLPLRFVWYSFWKYIYSWFQRPCVCWITCQLNYEQWVLSFVRKNPGQAVHCSIWKNWSELRILFVIKLFLMIEQPL